MTTRLRVLLGVLATTTSVGAAYHLWPGDRTIGAIVRRKVTTVLVVRVEPVRDESVWALVAALEPLLGVPIVPMSDGAVDERSQLSWEGDIYDANLLLERLDETAPRDKHLIGVTDQPMHDEEHWWLYGKARWGERRAIVSTAHLWDDDHEGDVRRRVFRDRMAKVGLHEFGHAIGFVHCDDPRCVMWMSNDASMLDYSRPRFCRACIRGWFDWHMDGE